MPVTLYPIIPSTITVHLGPPGSNAENVTVPFVEYIKNVASSELFPNWPENALRANIYAIVTFALNRYYNEWYPSRGYDFDITNTTAFDQAFVKDRDIFENIGRLVDEQFNSYVVKGDNINPYFTQFCNGTTSTCEGLSQWGTVTLANEGRTPFEILQFYYGDDIGIVENAPVQDITETYPAAPIQLGDRGNAVAVLQRQLNRIAQNYPAIPIIDPVDYVYGVSTENAVRAFQRIFNLPQTGVVDKATWYRIKQYYTGVRSLSELVGEGISIEEATLPFNTVLRLGDSGEQVRAIQYYYDVIAYFNDSLNTIPINGIYDETTDSAIRAFQTFYGLNVTGQVDSSTWNLMRRIYAETLSFLPDSVYGGNAKLYPGIVLSLGISNQSVTDLQNYLSFIASYYKDIPAVTVTGYYGEETRDAVYTFQRIFGITPTGAVGPVTWAEIARQYDILKASAN